MICCINQIIHATLEMTVCQIIVQMTLVPFDPVFTFFDLTFFLFDFFRAL